MEGAIIQRVTKTIQVDSREILRSFGFDPTKIRITSVLPGFTGRGAEHPIEFTIEEIDETGRRV